MSAVIDYIRENTRKKALIHFIGHSMGATALLVLLSTVPHYSLYLHSAILLAPLSFLFQVKGPLRYIAEGRNNRFLGNKEFVNAFPEHIVKQFCKGEEDLCTNPLILMANGGIDTNIQSVKHQLYDQTPGGGSTKTVLHYAQLIQSGLFQRFDYGTVKNLLVYGKAAPPEYALNEISSPLVVISSPSDWLSSTRDVETLSAHLTCDVTHHVVKRPGFSHIDFIWADDAPLLVYRLVLNLLQEIKDKSEALMI
ncbi:lipase 3-like [Choristoneura fumiferana]